MNKVTQNPQWKVGTTANSITNRNSGNVGIGTRAPTHGLNVTTSLQVGTAFNYTGVAGDLVAGMPTSNSRFLFGQSNFVFGGMTWNYHATAASAYLSISSDVSASSTITNQLVLKRDGNVGIGNVSPTAKLMIDGSADDEQLIVQAHSTQTTNIIALQLSTAAVIGRVTGAGRLGITSNLSTTLAQVGGTIFDHFADASNGTTVETDLYTDTLAANTFSTNGDKVKAHYQLICTGAALSTQQMKIYFGGTAIYDSGALAIGAVTDNFTLEVTVIRVSSTVVRCSVSVATDFATLFPYSKYTEITGLTLSNTQIIKITGTAAGAGALSDQITAKEGSVYWMPAA